MDRAPSRGLNAGGGRGNGIARHLRHEPNVGGDVPVPVLPGDGVQDLLFRRPVRRRALWASAIVSEIVDNIPFVATMIPVIKAMAPTFGGEDALLPLFWWALSLGACLVRLRLDVDRRGDLSSLPLAPIRPTHPFRRPRVVAKHSANGRKGRNFVLCTFAFKC